MQPVTISATLDCVTWGEMVVRPHDGSFLVRSGLTIAMGQSRVRRWFWALISWEFFLAERTFNQVMLVYRVPRDLPPFGLSFESIVMDDPIYATSSFDAYKIVAWLCRLVCSGLYETYHNRCPYEWGPSARGH